MKTGKYQQGATIYGIAFILLLIGFVAFTTLKLFPVYMENFTIRSSVESLASDVGQQYSGPLDIRNSLMKRLGMNNVTQVNYDDISVIREGPFYYVDVDYEVRVPFLSNIDLLVSFTNHAQVSAQ